MHVCMYVCVYVDMYLDGLILVFIYVDIIHIFLFRYYIFLLDSSQPRLESTNPQTQTETCVSCSLAISFYSLLLPVLAFSDRVNAMPPHGWSKLSDQEIQQAKQWYDDGDPCSEIADKLGRDKSVITRLLVKQVPRLQQGRPTALTKGNIAFMKRKLAQLVKAADCRYTVTVAMLKKACNFKVSQRCITTALHNEGIYFRSCGRSQFWQLPTSQLAWLLPGNTIWSQNHGGTNLCTQPLMESSLRLAWMRLPEHVLPNGPRLELTGAREKDWMQDTWSPRAPWITTQEPVVCWF